MSTAAPVGLTRSPTRWALPARPPEQWLGPAWSAAATLLLGLAVVVPLTALLRTDPRTPVVVGTAALAVLVACAATVLALCLVVQASVARDRRLIVVAVAPLVLHPWGLALAATVPREDERPAPALLLHVVLPLLALLAPRTRRLPLWGTGVLAVVVAGAGVLLAPAVRDLSADRLRLAFGAALAVAVAALVVWLRTTPRRGPWLWVAAALVLSGAALAGGLLHAERAGTSWEPLLGALPLVVPAAGLGLLSAGGYLRQARRWRDLEQEARDSRIPTALLPGRSISPEDDEGLPGPAEVQAVLAQEAVAVALQPVLHLPTGTVVGQEALARFEGRIPTDRWFRGASRYGHGLALETLCLRRALALLPDLPADQFLAVNLSPAALTEPEVLAVLEAADLARVVVEITEHEAVADYPAVRATLDRLRAGGARTAVDDAGSGYASLRHVLLLQPEVIKLDTALVRDLPTDARGRDLVLALTSFAQEVGSTVLAEGIETREQLEALLAIGVELGQGWHLGVPTVPGEETPRR